MKRRTFIKSSTLSGIALATIPTYAFTKINLPYDELIGKGNPELFGDNYKLRKDVHQSFIKMKAEALKVGINIQVVSSYETLIIKIEYGLVNTILLQNMAYLLKKQSIK